MSEGEATQVPGLCSSWWMQCFVRIASGSEVDDGCIPELVLKFVPRSKFFGMTSFPVVPQGTAESKN